MFLRGARGGGKDRSHSAEERERVCSVSRVLELQSVHHGQCGVGFCVGCVQCAFVRMTECEKLTNEADGRGAMREEHKRVRR